MPEEHLIFVEVALTKGVQNLIQNVLSDNRDELDEEDADTAVFYSNSNCQDGLAEQNEVAASASIKSLAKQAGLGLLNRHSEDQI